MKILFALGALTIMLIGGLIYLEIVDSGNGARDHIQDRQCLTGSDARSSRSPGGDVLPEELRSSNVEDLERFVCADLPSLQSTAWTFEGGSALRTEDLAEQSEEQSGLRRVLMTFRNPVTDSQMNLTVIVNGTPSSEAGAEVVQIRGTEGYLHRPPSEPGVATIQWQEGRRVLIASTTVHPTSTTEEFLELLESLE